jgi:hypothetical protein
MSNLIEHSYRLRREKVAGLMMQQGWTIPSLAKAAGVDKSSIKRLFQGCRLRMSTIAPVAEALGQTPDTLIDRGDSQPEFADHPESAPSDGTSNVPPVTNSPGESAADAAVPELQHACIRIDVHVNMPYQSFSEKKDIPKMFGEIRETIDQMGGFVVEYVGPSNSVRIIFLATRRTDADHFLSAFAEGKFNSLRMTDARILADDIEPEDDDNIRAPGDLESETAADCPTPSSSTNVEEQPKSKEIDSTVHFGSPKSSSSTATVEFTKPSAIAAAAAAGAMLGTLIFPVFGPLAGALLAAYSAELVLKYRQEQSKSELSDESNPPPPKEND